MNTAAPESKGFSSARLKRIGRLMQDYVDRGELAGMFVSVARQGATVYQQAVGAMDREAHKPMEKEAIFRIASMSKPITSVAAMMLYEQGAFHLNTPISKFIPEFKKMKVWVKENEDGPELVALDREVTFRHLFTHTSGLSYGSNPEHDPVDRLFTRSQEKMQQDQIPPTIENVVAQIVQLPLAFQPGTHWRYGMNIEVLGRLIEVIAGQSLDQFLRTRIFEPLGMVDTGFFVPAEKCDRLAGLYGHLPGQEGLRRMEGQVPTELPVFQSGGGGLFSTLPDYARFLQMLVNGGELDGARLLSPQTVKLYSMNFAPEQALPYGFAPKEDLYHAGYGFSLGTRVLMDVSQTGMAGNVGEFGWDGAFSTYFWVDPTLQLYGLLMLQHYPNAYYPVAQQFKQLTYQALVA